MSVESPKVRSLKRIGMTRAKGADAHVIHSAEIHHENRDAKRQWFDV